ncbi:hypothetical protein Golax_003690 [Gossypium laxum]|uniref:Plastid lipid-associated protein/fibrillin conserved domain-containing protein n=1 Tax=Gossypium laxum TaxID=34288 RepID=A0A7J9AHZ8_9ROSI|nr:hypothetical protein [Gossypium laxum]
MMDNAKLNSLLTWQHVIQFLTGAVGPLWITYTPRSLDFWFKPATALLLKVIWDIRRPWQLVPSRYRPPCPNLNPHFLDRNPLIYPYTALRLRSNPSVSGFPQVIKTDGGVSLTTKQHQEVAQVANELNKYCVDEPVKCPLIFGDWDVVYCSNPTSPGGGYRSALGRLFFKTKDMVQAVEAPDSVRNKVSFSVFGFLEGEVSLKGKLKVLDHQWIQVIFQPPELRVGAMGFQYGGESEVKLQITYIDEKIRLGKGSRGSLFVFRRRHGGSTNV